MKLTRMKMYRISKIDFKNQVNGTVSLKFSTNVSYQVKYNKTNICEGVLKMRISDPNNPNSISLDLEISGIYEIIGEGTKEEIHIETFKELFIYAKSFVTTITAVAGIKPLPVSDIDFENQNIIRFNNNMMKPHPSDDDTKNGFDDTVDGPDGTF